jgi:hypothetical protein
MEYEMDPSLTTPMMMINPMDKPTMTPEQQAPEVINISAPKFKLVLPFASFDRSTPTKFAGSILNWTALLSCLLLVFLMGRYGLTSGKTMSVFVVCIIFTVATTVLLSSSGYQRR